MALRKRLPAYGKPLLLARRAGEHPVEILLIYGERWWPEKAFAHLPRIAVKPAEYVPGTIDWRICTGVRVIVLDRGDGIADWAEPTEKNCDAAWGRFYYLLGELAEFAAEIEIVPEQVKPFTAAAAAYANRWVRKDARRSVWPAWWNDEREAALQRRFDGWLADRVTAATAQPEAAGGRAQ